MKFTFTLVLLFCLGSWGNLFSQTPTKSDKILIKLSKKIKGLKSFYVEYSAVVKNADLGRNDSYSGKGWVKNSKYFATYGSNTIICNGLKSWSIISRDKEVYESDNSDDEETINPKKLMTIWETGFNNKYVKLDKIGAVSVDVIDLFPKNPKKSNYKSITVYINSANNELKKAVIKMKDGTLMSYSVNKFAANVDVSDTKFAFDRKKYPGYRVIRN